MQEIDPKDVCVSSVTYAELVHGVEKVQPLRKQIGTLSKSGIVRTQASI